MKAKMVPVSFSESIIGLAVTLGLLLGTAACVAYGISSAVEGGQPGWLAIYGMVGILLGWVISSLSRKWWGILAAGIIGIFFVWLFQAQSLNSSCKLIWLLGNQVMGKVFFVPVISTNSLIPIIQTTSGIIAGMAGVYLRFYAWIRTLAEQNTIIDPFVINILWGIPVWFVFSWMGWSTRRHNQAMTSLLPTLVLFAGVFGFVHAKTSFLVVALSLILPFIVLVTQLEHEQRWLQNNYDFSRDIRFDLALTALPICIGLVIMASVMPSISIKKLAQEARDIFTSPNSQPVSESLGLHPQAADDNPAYPLQTAGLPRSHLLGSGPELSKKIVMVVSTSEMPPMSISGLQTSPVPVHYWQSITYDIYYSQGWLSSYIHSKSYGADEIALSDPLATRTILHQLISPVENLNNIVFASGDVITVNAPFQVSLREYEDPFAVTSKEKNYEVTSSIIVPDPTLLRKASVNYPDWIKQRYLSLPDNLPSRVRVLAASLTATAPTPYDRARAIETYLRSFPYTLQLDAPPPGKDVVDYFLFELKKGYCDYFASAMVVLARAAGLPARLAVGYASGTYDPINAQYVVTEADAHSWVEIYFPNYGWVEFEPTSNRPEFESNSTAENGIIGKPPFLLTPTPGMNFKIVQDLSQKATFILYSIILIIVILGSVMFINRLRYSRLTSQKMMQSVYRDLLSCCQWMQVPVLPGSTPLELAGSFAQRLKDMNLKSRRPSHLIFLQNEIMSLITLYNRSIFSSHPITKRDAYLAHQSMSKLQWWFIAVWISSKLRI